MGKGEEIVVVIDGDGNVSGEIFNGPGGQGCLDKLDAILGELGPRRSKPKEDAFKEHRQSVGKVGAKA